jgi:hypothetical protein
MQSHEESAKTHGGKAASVGENMLTKQNFNGNCFKCRRKGGVLVEDIGEMVKQL